MKLHILNLHDLYEELAYILDYAIYLDKEEAEETIYDF